MKISRLLELQNQVSVKNSLQSNFGDSFLIEYNSIYRSVREKTINYGFIFTNQLTENFLALPLSQLDQFLKSKKIPYFDNVTILKEIERRIPQTTTWDELSDNLKRNYLFHESCHAIARTLSNELINKNISQIQKIVQLMIEESFANTCELLANAEVDQAAHRIFFEANSYCVMFDEHSLIKELIQDFGLPQMMKFTLICYLHANFLHEKIDEKSFNTILSFLVKNEAKLNELKKDPKKIKKLRVIAKMAFQLNPRFRMVISGFYLRLSGLKIETAQLQKIDFISLVTEEKSFNQLIENLSLIFYEKN